eukprot:UN26750
MVFMDFSAHFTWYEKFLVNMAFIFRFTHAEEIEEGVGKKKMQEKIKELLMNECNEVPLILIFLIHSSFLRIPIVFLNMTQSKVHFV